jgi:hypothetical protein
VFVVNSYKILLVELQYKYVLRVVGFNMLYCYSNKAKRMIHICSVDGNESDTPEMALLCTDWFVLVIYILLITRSLYEFVKMNGDDTRENRFVL